MPDVIRNYDEFLYYQTNSSFFWVVEYSPETLGYNAQTHEYNVDSKRYSLFRTECLTRPQDFKDRLDNGAYRIWTTTPREIPW